MMRSTIALLAAAALAATPAVAQDYNQANATVATNEVAPADMNAAVPTVPANDMAAVPAPQTEPARRRLRPVAAAASHGD